MKILILSLLISCAADTDKPVKPLGANRQQATIQEGRDNISNPAVPATQVPPAGTPQVIPPVWP